MARLRTITLPPRRRDGDDEQPFAFILDRCDGTFTDADTWQRFAERCGAADLIVTELDIDLDEAPAEVEIPDEALDHLAQFVREQVQHALNSAVLLRPGSDDGIAARLDDLGLMPNPPASPGPAPQAATPTQARTPRSTWGDQSQPDPREKIPGWQPDTTDLIGNAVDEAVGRG